MHAIRLRTPIIYYGGKQKLASRIISLIPRHTLYCEPFIGGAAIFFAKRPSEIEVINDTNGELINFYRTLKEDFSALEAEISTSLHSRDLHRKASLIYNNPDMFDSVKRAWAVWILSTQSFAGMLDGTWDSICQKTPQQKNQYQTSRLHPHFCTKTATLSAGMCRCIIRHRKQGYPRELLLLRSSLL